MHTLFLSIIPFIIQVTIINRIYCHIPLVTSLIKYNPIMLYYLLGAERFLEDITYLI